MAPPSRCRLSISGDLETKFAKTLAVNLEARGGSEAPLHCTWRDDATIPLKGNIENEVLNLSFSNGGNQLVAVGNDPNHTMFVYDWASGSLIYSSHISNL